MDPKRIQEMENKALMNHEMSNIIQGEDIVKSNKKAIQTNKERNKLEAK